MLGHDAVLQQLPSTCMSLQSLLCSACRGTRAACGGLQSQPQHLHAGEQGLMADTRTYAVMLTTRRYHIKQLG